MASFSTRLRMARHAVVSAVLLLLQINASACAGVIDLHAAQIVKPNDLSGPETKAVEMLIDEIASRTRVRLSAATEWPMDIRTPTIFVGPASSLEHSTSRFAKDLTADSEKRPAEGFRIRTFMDAGRAPAIFIVGNDARGVLFGVGKFLRSLKMSRDHIQLSAPLNVTSSPAKLIRGHQLGYRPKTNSYDAWDLVQWEHYIRDLAAFGCNSIELIPPRSDDAADSPHFPLPQLETMIGMSQLAADYGLDVWIWYPAMEAGYPTPESIDAAVEEWGAVLSRLPRVDALFVPSGDPGDASPQELMKMLSAQAVQLKRLHPHARIWISLQGFTQPQFEDMLSLVKREPDWLGGVVHGPQTRVSVATLRKLVPSRYPIRGYPDITHSMRCEYPVPDWDLAFALTEGREVINPRPVDETQIFGQYKDDTQGVITYSEGCNDDVNKAIWSALCWNPSSQPADTLREYSGYFIGEDLANDFAEGLSALEQNWRGPLLANDRVTATLQKFVAMERAATPRTLRNWRFQQALYRAYYDAYERRRLIDETAAEAAAMEALAKAPESGAINAIEAAEKLLNRSGSSVELAALASRIRELAESLFQSVGMQLSVAKYRAIDVGRGANLDELDVPLNNRAWLKSRFAEVRRIDDEAARLRAIAAIVHWTDPGPDGFYDDLGNPGRQPHLVRHEAYAQDPGYLRSPTVGFRSQLDWRRSWCSHVDGLYQTPVSLHYVGLDPRGHYKLRVVYAGDAFDVQVRLIATTTSENSERREIEVHPFQPKPQPVRPVEFEIPREATSGGELTLTWQCNAERGGPGRGCQIAEVWLIKVGAEQN
jgi:hypothetical protein